jgi:hypothetical protein
MKNDSQFDICGMCSVGDYKVVHTDMGFTFRFRDCKKFVLVEIFLDLFFGVEPYHLLFANIRVWED